MASTPVDSLQAIVGAGHAFAFDDPRGRAYRSLLGFLADHAVELRAVAMPADVDSLQAAMRYAAGAGLSVWSMPNAAGNGMRLGAARQPGILLDLRRMNRILEVDADSACALIEPGVSYAELDRHLRAGAIPLWIDSDRAADNSIAGSICARNFGYTPYGDHVQMQCGMEVVRDDGELLRTGMGALPGSDTWQLFKYNFGPYVDGLFTQSDLAIVSKIGLWLMPPPPRYWPFMARLATIAALDPLVEILRPLKIGMVIPGTVVISHVALDLAPYRPRHELLGADGRLDAAGMAARHGLGVWNVYGALYGSADNVAAAWETLEAGLLGIAGVDVLLAQDRPADPWWQDRQRLMRGEPARAPFDLSAWGGPSCLTLTAAAPIEGEHARRMEEIVRTTLAGRGRDYLCEYLVVWRNLLKRIYLPHDGSQAAARAQAESAALALVERLAAAGYGIVDESPALRFAVDRHFGATPFADLIERLRRALRVEAG